MDNFQLGRRVHAVRLRLKLRQQDVAQLAHVSQSIVSQIDRGDIEGLQLRTIRAVLGALEIELGVDARWRGGELDRLVDEDHAGIVGAIAGLLQTDGWETQVEVSFAVYGERGSIDLLAWHPVARILLVVEVKTVLYSVEETLRRHDVKVRLGRGIAAERFGWQPAATARLLVLPDASTPRRRVARHDAVLGRAYPLRSDVARAWLRQPSGSAGLLLFASPNRRGAASQLRVTRVRIRKHRGQAA
jgi:transcriptional regulator with XRE-family HTH domain